MHASTHTQVLFKVSKVAVSSLVFNASVWKGGVKLYDANPVTVSPGPALLGAR